MQDRYAGDIGDYGKFGLLKALQAEGFRLGINWYMATPPTKREKENEDGKHRIAERYDACDPALAETLRAISTSPERSIKALEQAALLDAARTVYYGKMVEVAGRAQWHEDALQALADCDLVFLDPDNGLLVKSVGRRSAKSVKYVFDEELNDYLARGQSVVLYNHRARKPAVQYFQELADRCAALPAAQGKPICALTFPKGTIRDYLLIAATPDHAHRIHQALNHMTQGAWARLGLCGEEAVVLMEGGEWQSEEELMDDAWEIYNSSVNKPTSVQRDCVETLRNLYRKSFNQEVADAFANAIFNLSLRVTLEEMESILAELEKLLQDSPTECIAERVGRLTFNVSLLSETKDERKLSQYAQKIEKLYNKYPTKELAEPLAKIWYQLATCKSSIGSDAIKRILDLCSEVADPEVNTVYARVLFNPIYPVENREERIDRFLSTSQSLEAFQLYAKSDYFPAHNEALKSFTIAPSYAMEALATNLNESFDRFKAHPAYLGLKVEILSLLYTALDIKRLLIVPKTNVAICHYTKLENLKHLIPPKEKEAMLRMSNAEYMNDPSEGKTLIEVLSNGECMEDVNEEGSNIYVSCFTTAVDELPMWSMYGNDGAGCCLVFQRDYFDYTHENISRDYLLKSDQIDESNFLYRVCYLSRVDDELTISFETFEEDKKENLDDLMIEALGQLGHHYNAIKSIKEPAAEEIITLILDQIRYLFKDRSYEHECELRLIKYSESPLLDEDRWIVPQLYVEVSKPLSYSGVILGPKVEQINRILPYLRYTGKVQTVKKSTIKYR